MTNTIKRIEELFRDITVRNTKTQEAKKQGPWGWIAAVVLSLISLVGIGVAMYYVGRQAKALAKAHTKLEQERVDQEQARHEALREPLQRRRTELLDALQSQEFDLKARERRLAEGRDAHTARERRLAGLKAWKDINEA